jgi:TatD DNase family protein
MALSLVDTHCHLDDRRFEHDLPAVLLRATNVGVVRIICIGTDLASSRALLELACAHDMLSAVVGLHPNHVSEAAPGDWDAIVALANLPGVVGIGESGLDRHWDKTPFPIQEDYFTRHLVLARTLAKPIVIHNREADADTVRLLRDEFERHGPIRGVLHSCAADAPTVESCLAMGLHISFSGMITYKNANAIRAIAALVPDDRLLIETDAPYLSPVPVRGQRNEPAFVAHTAAAIATARNSSLETIGEHSTRNATDLFR